MSRLKNPVRAIREPFGTAGLVVAIVALIAALGGTAFAAAKLNSTQKKEVKSIAKAEATKVAKPGPAGPVGAAGAAGTKGDPGSAGQKGATGLTGATGPTGIGATGPTGNIGATLTSGHTETGVWGDSVKEAPTSTEKAIPISFPIPLAAASSEAFVLNRAETLAEAGTGGCTGTVEHPTAPAGTLCVYTAEEADGYEDEGFAVFNEEPGYLPTGTLILFSSKNTAAPALFSRNGSWAVTAP